MKIVTRIAPGVSGPLHLGSLYNALLNYTYAKRNNGEVFLRLDAPYKTGPTNRFECEIEEALQAFGLTPDFVVKQTNRLAVYREQLEDILDHPDVYFCKCQNEDIANRLDSGSDGYVIKRHDKYPPSCAIKKVIISDELGKNLAKEATITASITAPGGFESENIISDDGNVWKPYNSWYYGHVNPVIKFTWRSPILANYIKIVWSKRSAKGYQVYVDNKMIAEIGKFKEPVTIGLHYKKCNELSIVLTEFNTTIQKEYAYDNYCRDKNLCLPLDNSNTFVRKKCKDYVDVLLWNGLERKVDLAFRSAIDDKEFGTTHKFRGIDIDVFMGLERRCAELIDHKFVNIRHGLILHPNMYKYAKSTGAPDIMSYLLDGKSPEQVLSGLALLTGLIDEPKVFTLSQLVNKIKFPNDTRNVVIHG